MKIICSKCNNEIIGNPKFCRKCGASKEYFIEEVEGNFCPECGNKCLPDDLFCPECGFNLSTDLKEEIKVTDEWDTVNTEVDEWNSNDFSSDEFNENDNQDEWKDLVNNFESIDESDKFIDFDYKKNSKGEITIVKLKDEYAMEVVVPNGVTVIGNSAFEGSNALTISLPEGIKTIGKRAFANCPNLKELIVPNSVIMIGDEAFKDSSNLLVSLPTNISIIGKNILIGTLTEVKEKEKENNNNLMEASKEYDLAKELISNKKFDEAIDYLVKSANAGYVDSMIYLGQIYSHGISLGYSLIKNYCNIDKALYWLKKAAFEYNNPSAAYKICLDSRIYKEYKEYSSNAFHLLLDLKSNNNIDAYDYVGSCYYLGAGITEDYKMAAIHFEYAYENGKIDCLNSLIDSCYRIKDKSKYYKYCKIKYDNFKFIKNNESEMNDFLNVSLKMIEIYYKGIGTSKDYNLILKIVSKVFDILNKEFGNRLEKKTDLYESMYSLLTINLGYSNPYSYKISNFIYYLALLIYNGYAGFEKNPNYATSIMNKIKNYCSEAEKWLKKIN